MKNDVFKVVLLQALPASGKSEVRHFMANIEPERLAAEFHIGETLQLDDFPYVHMMRCIDNALQDMGEPRIFYPGEDPFTDGRDWGTLIALLNEDYHDLMNRNVIRTDSAAGLLFDRIDRAGQTVGLPPRMGLLREDILERLASLLEKDARDMLEAKHAAYPESFENKTIVIECARGGPDGASMPLEGTFGYQYSLPIFCPEILRDAVLLYIWVTPEESRRKNFDRADPDDPGSNLHHGVPLSVMLGDYGCDDMHYLLRQSERENALTIQAHGQTYYVPVGVFDNRIDKTSFLRADPSQWDKDMVDEVTRAIRSATDVMFEGYENK